MLRWELREFQQQNLLNKLFREAGELVEDNDSDHYYNFFRELAILVLVTLPVMWGEGIDEAMTDVEAASDSKVNAQFFSMLWQIKGFQKTPEEGVSLALKIAEESFRRASVPFTRDYQRQRVMEQEKVYGGPATDEISEEEREAAFREAELSEGRTEEVDLMEQAKRVLQSIGRPD